MNNDLNIDKIIEILHKHHFKYDFEQDPAILNEFFILQRTKILPCDISEEEIIALNRYRGNLIAVCKKEDLWLVISFINNKTNTIIEILKNENNENNEKLILEPEFSKNYFVKILNKNDISIAQKILDIYSQWFLIKVKDYFTNKDSIQINRHGVYFFKEIKSGQEFLLEDIIYQSYNFINSFKN